MSSNDNDPASAGQVHHTSDSHGQAALLLVESLIHGLCEQAIIRTTGAVEIVERAVEVQAELAAEADGAAAPMWRSHALLSSIATSLKGEGDGDPRPSI